MERRQFLIRLAVVVAGAPAAWSLSGCGDDGNNELGSGPTPTSPPGDTPTSPPAATATSPPATATSPPPATATPPATRTATSRASTATPTASPTPTTGLSDFSVTSSVVGAHSHDITIRAADLAAGTGVTYTSTAAFGHVHTVTLTSQIISDLNAGGTETVISNPDNTGHSHDWVITEP
jgi:hypothetical protein